MIAATAEIHPCPECGEPLFMGNDASSNWHDKWYVTCKKGCHRVEGLTITEALECLETKEGDDGVQESQ